MSDKESTEAFYSGIICALLVVVNDGYESLAEEILKGCDLKAVRRIARREGDTKIVKLVDNLRLQDADGIDAGRERKGEE